MQESVAIGQKEHKQTLNTLSSCNKSQSLLVGTPFYRGFRTPALEHLIGWGLNTTQLTGQLMSAFRIEWDWLGSPAGVQILLITVLPRDLFTSTLKCTRLVKLGSVMANFNCAAPDQLQLSQHVVPVCPMVGSELCCGEEHWPLAQQHSCLCLLLCCCATRDMWGIMGTREGREAELVQLS